MLIIGERINSSRKPIAQAIEAHDADFIQKEAIMQAESGADYIDVKTGAFMDKEADQLKWDIETAQETVVKTDAEKLSVIEVETTEIHQQVTEMLRKTLPMDVLVDLHEILCGDDMICPQFTPEGKLLSYDGSHLTRDGAKYLGELMFQDSKLNRYLP